MDEQRRQNLIEAYLDHRLSSEDRSELEAELIRSPEMRTLFWQCVQQHAGTWELLAEAQGKNLAISESAIRSREELGLPVSVAAAGTSGPTALVNVGPRMKTRRVAAAGRRERNGSAAGRFLWVAAAAVLLLAVGVMAWRYANPAKTPDGGTVAQAQPMAAVGAIGQNGGWVIHGTASSPLTAGAKLYPGDMVKTSAGTAETAGAEVQFADGTRLNLQPSTQLTLISDVQGKALDLFGGSFTADVSPQPAGKPMTVATPHAAIRVVGTRFILTVGGTSTRLQVDEGKVRLTRAGDQQMVDVAQAQFVVAGLEGALTVQAVEPPRVASTEPKHEEPKHEEPKREEPKREAPTGDKLAEDEVIGRVLEIAVNKQSFQLRVAKAGKADLVNTEMKFAANWVREGDHAGPKEADVRVIRELRTGDVVRIQFTQDEHYRFTTLKVVERAPRDIPHEAPQPKREPEHKEMAPEMQQK